MSDITEKWYQRATVTVQPQDRLTLVKEVVASEDAPEFLRTAARRSMSSLEAYIHGGMSDAKELHIAEKAFASLKIAFGDVK